MSLFIVGVNNRSAFPWDFILNPGKKIIGNNRTKRQKNLQYNTNNGPKKVARTMIKSRGVGVAHIKKHTHTRSPSNKFH